MRTRDYNIDLIKIISCICVVGLHTVGKYNSVGNIILYYLCEFAIPMFFVTSGYLILNGGYNKNDWKHSAHKVLKIVRIIVLWNIIYYLYGIIKLVLTKQDWTFPALDLVLQTAKSIIQEGACWHFWYLGALGIVYIFVPTLKRLDLRKRRIIFWGLFAICIFLQGASMICGFSVQSNVVQTLRVWTWFLYFLLGGEMIEFIPLMEKRLSFNVHFILLALCSAGMLIYQIIVGNRLIQSSAQSFLNVEYFYDSISTIVWVGLLFSLIKRCSVKAKVQPTISSLSRLTLGIYCSHLLVRDLFSHFLGLDSFTQTLLAWISILFFSVALTEVFRRLPFGKWFVAL